MITRIFLSVVAICAYGWINGVLNPISAIGSGRMAGGQFENSDVDYLVSIYGMNFFQSIGIPFFVLLIVLAIIWWEPARQYLRKAGENLAVLFLVGAALMLASPHDANAFFEKTDRTEIYTILPNESAFWIPDVGANMDSQTKMDSEAYLNENKIAAKRFIIPHQKLTGSAGNSMFSGWDYFVPTGRLIIVDRTPFSREWVDAGDRGTSALKQGFPCQTKEGLNITAGVSIGTSVLEANAAKFLYRFGVKSPVGQIVGDASSIAEDGKIIFASVYHGRSLQEVMDDVGRKKVQTLVCNEIGTRTFDEANAQMIAIMDEIEKKVTAYFAGVGITTDFIGWGDTFGFDEAIQKSVNSRYIAAQDRKNADLLAPVTATIQTLAAANAQRSFGEKTDGKLPTTFVGPAPEIASPFLTMPAAPKSPVK